jgi:hypothetical protein
VDVAVAAVNKLPVAVKRLVSDDGTTGLQVLDGLVTEQTLLAYWVRPRL